MPIKQTGKSVKRRGTPSAGPSTLMGFRTNDHYMFKNLVKNLVSFGSSGTYAFPGDLTSDGYPKNGASVSANIFGFVYFPSNLSASETFVMKMTNTGGTVGGDIQLARGTPGFTGAVASSGSIVGGTGANLTMTGTNPRVTFQFDTSVPESCTFNFLAGGTFSGASNLVICRQSDEAAIDALTSPTDMFNEDWLDVYRSLRNKVFRPMGWAATNFSNVSQYGYRMRWDTGLSCFADQWPPGAWVGTVSGTNTYTCSSPADMSGEPVFGSVVQGQITNANTSTTPTLKTSGMVAGKTIVNIYGSALSVGAITANALGTFVFDNLLDRWIYLAGGILLSVPLEVQVGLCNKLTTHLWRNIPTLYDDVSVTAEATYVANNLNGSLTSYWEYSNETWNFAFPQTSYLGARGAAIGFRSSDNRQYFGAHALRHRQMMELITAAHRTGIKRVMGVQAFGDRGLTGAYNLYRLQGQDLHQDDGTTGGTNYNSLVGTDYNTAPNRPVDYTEVISPAQYTEGAQCRQFDTDYVDDFNAGFNINNLTAAADTLDVSFLDRDVRQGTRSNGSLGPFTMKGFKDGSPGSTPIYSDWNTIAASYSPTKLVEWYEGACGSCTYPSTSTCTTIGISTTYGGAGGKIDLLIQAWKASGLFNATTFEQLGDAVSQPLSATPAWLIVEGPTIWSLMTSDVFSTKLQSFYAVARFNGT